MADLRAQGRDGRHVIDTERRIARMIREMNWRRVADIRPDRFTEWRATLECSAKTRHAYQISVVAFCEWMRKTGRIASNSIVGLPRVELRGKKVRETRALTVDEPRSLKWGDCDLDTLRPCVLLRENATKDREKRVKFLCGDEGWLGKCCRTIIANRLE